MEPDGRPEGTRPIPSERRLDLVEDGLETHRIVVGDRGENLAVHLDPGLFQAVDKSRVGQAVLTHRGVDALDPKARNSRFFTRRSR